MKTRILCFLALSCFTMMAVTGAAQASIPTLPDPFTQVVDQNGNPLFHPITGDPLIVSSKHDHFYSYSADLLTQLGFPGFDTSVGTGGLDLLVYTGAVGANNASVPGGPFPNPLLTPGGGADSFSGTWGATGMYSPVAVDSVLNFLHSYDEDLNTPVFNFDMNQTGSAPTVLMNGQIRIWDPLTGTVVDSWAFDDIDNGVYDPDSFVTAFGKMDVGLCFNKKGDPVACYELDNNKGSGQLDFIAFAPSMDLSQYQGKGYQLLADFRLIGATNGFEELFMTGAVAPGNTTVPEPMTVALVGGALFGLFGYRRRQK